MTVKVINGTITTGYTLAAGYSALSVTSSGSIASATGTAGTLGAYKVPGGAGQNAGAAALTLPNSANVTNQGQIEGGAGGAGGGGGGGYYNPYIFEAIPASGAGDGGSGGVGLLSSALSTISNSGLIAGGRGGNGGQGNGGPSGSGGAGGVAILASANIAITNTGTIIGGGGGDAAATGANWTIFYAGASGNGGDGILSSAGVSITNFGLIAGGGASRYAYNYRHPGKQGAGGVGVDCSALSTITNYGSIFGGYGIAGREAVVLRSGGDVSNFGTIQSGIVGLRYNGPYTTAAVNIYDAGNIVNGNIADRSALILGYTGINFEANGTITNYGTIEGQGPFGGPLVAIQFGSSSDVLVVEAGSYIYGVVNGAGGTLALGAGGGAGTFSITGGTGYYRGFSAYQVQTGASWSLVGKNTITNLEVDGTLSLQGATLTNLSGVTLTNGVFTVGIGGLLQLPDNSPIAVLDATVELNGAGSTIESLDTLTSSEVTLEDSLTSVGPGGVLEVLGGRNWASVQSLSNAGTIEIAGGTFSASLTNDAGHTLTGGTLIAGVGGVVQLQDNSPITTLDAVVELIGAGSEIQSLRTTAPPTELTLEWGLSTIAAGGELEILGGRNWSSPHTITNSGSLVMGGGSFHPQALINSGTVSGFGTIAAGTADTGRIISQGGTLTLAAAVNLSGGGTFTNTASVVQQNTVTLTSGTITNQAGATWSLIGDIALASGGVGSFVNSGDLVFDGGHIGVQIANSGTITVAAGETGDLRAGQVSNFSGTVLTGGVFIVDAGATLLAPDNGPVEVLSATVELAGAGSTLESFDTGTSSEVGLEKSLVTITSTGGLDLAGGRNWNSTQTLFNAGSIGLAGSGFAPASLVSSGTVVGFGTIAAPTTDSGVIVAQDGALALPSAVDVTAGGSIVNGATINQSGIVTLTDGSITDQAGAVWNLANGIVLAAGGSGEFINDGTLSRAAASGVNHIGVDFTNAATGTVTIGGGLEFDGPANDLTGTIGGAGTLVFGGGATALEAGVDLAVADVLLKGAATSVTANGNVAFAGKWSQTGGVLSVALGTLTFTGVGDAFTGTLAGAGSVNFAAGSDLLQNVTLSAAHTDVGGAGVTLQGVITLAGELDAVASSPTIAASGATLKGLGSLVLGGAAAGVLHGATSTARLINGSTIRGAGQLGGGKLSLVNQAGGAIIGDGSTALIIDTGANTISNSGTLEALQGILVVDSAVSGLGKVLIGEGGTAEFASTFNEAVTFAASGGTLELAKAYAGTIANFSNVGLSTLELDSLSFVAGATMASFSGNSTAGLLTVSNGAQSATIHLSGDFTASKWLVTADGHGGVSVRVAATKTISASYSSGYSIASNYVGAELTPSATVTGVHGAVGSGGPYGGTGGTGGAALTMPAGGSLTIQGLIQGGGGGAGGYGSQFYRFPSPGHYGYFYGGGGGDGGRGGVGLLCPSQTTITNSGVIVGGAGGYGGAGQSKDWRTHYYGFGGAGGQGGDGVSVSAVVSITNSGTIAGGVGGQGGAFIYGSSGIGGDGVRSSAAISITNDGLIAGGAGGASLGSAGGGGGVAIDCAVASAITNTATIAGGAGAAGLGYPTSIGGTGGDAIILRGGGEITNLGMIYGGAAGQSASGQPHSGTGIALNAGGDVTNGSASIRTSTIEGFVGVSMVGTGSVTNFGTIEGTGGTSVSFGSASDLLIGEGGSDFIGAVVGGGGTLELLAGGAGTIGAVSNFSTVTVAAGAVWTMEGSTTVGSNWTLSSTSTLSVSGTLTDAGSFDQTGIIALANGSIVNNWGAHWTLANGVTLVSGDTGTFTNAGTLTRGAVGSVNNISADFINIGTVEITSGTLFFNGLANSFTGTVTGAGTLGFGGGVSTLGPGLTVTTAAIAIKGASTSVTLDENLAWGGGWNQSSGSVSVTSGDTLNLTGAGGSLSGTLTGAGTVDFTGGSDTFKGLTLSAAHMNIVGTEVALNGAIGLVGQVVATGSTFSVAATSATLSGGGTLNLAGGADVVTGATATARLTNAGDHIVGAGVLGGGQMILFNQNGGVIDGTGVLTIDTGTQTITNAGLIEATGAGSVTIASALSNTNRLVAAKGTLTLSGAVTGIGKVLIDGGGTADFASTFNEAVAFASGGGELELAHSQSYAGTIAGFGTVGAKLDLADINFGAGTKATYSGATTSGVLTITDGTHTAKIHLAGNFTGSTFTLASDGHGGTTVVDPPAAGTASATSFTSAMAAFAPTAAAMTSGVHRETPSARLLAARS